MGSAVVSGFSSGGSRLGQSLDIPAQGTTTSDSKTDLAIFRPSIGLWGILLSSTNFASYKSVALGTSAVTPVVGTTTATA